jgi:hypothetical protein
VAPPVARPFDVEEAIGEALAASTPPPIASAPASSIPPAFASSPAPAFDPSIYDEPPPKESNLAVIIGVVFAILLLGGAVAVYFLTQ